MLADLNSAETSEKLRMEIEKRSLDYILGDFERRDCTVWSSWEEPWQRVKEWRPRRPRQEVGQNVQVFVDEITCIWDLLSNTPANQEENGIRQYRE